MLVRFCLFAVGLLVALPPAAGAATVNSVDGSEVEVLDSGSEANDLTVTLDRDRRSLRITDTIVPLTARGTRCQSLAPGTVECSVEDQLSVFVHAGGGDDRVSTATEAELFGGEGNDRLRAGEASGIQGGPGDDTLEAGGRGFVELKGDGGDDLLLGSRGPDMLEGGEGHDTFRAGRGSDDVRAYDGDAGPGEQIDCGGGSDGVQSFDPGDVVGASCEGAFVEGVRLEPPRVRSGRALLRVAPGEFDDRSGRVRITRPDTGARLASGSFRRLARRSFSHRLSMRLTPAGRAYLRPPRGRLVRVELTFRGRGAGTFTMTAEAR